MEKENYPDEFVRGMADKAWVSAEGWVLPGAFQFDPVRSDGYCELSINWCDDEHAIEVALNQVSSRTGKIQFVAGLARLSRASMEILLRGHFEEKRLNYERSPIKENVVNHNVENPYHGNLLLSNNTSPALKKVIQASLSALAGNDIIPQVLK